MTVRVGANSVVKANTNRSFELMTRIVIRACARNVGTSGVGLVLNDTARALSALVLERPGSTSKYATTFGGIIRDNFQTGTRTSYTAASD